MGKALGAAVFLPSGLDSPTIGGLWERRKSGFPTDATNGPARVGEALPPSGTGA